VKTGKEEHPGNECPQSIWNRSHLLFEAPDC
jgi:hypothetical protein